jgi:YVTN family beta-propeller protein
MSTMKCSAGAVRLGLYLMLALGVSASGAPAAPGAERLYISDERGGNVVIVDAQSGNVIARVPVGKRPRGIAVSPDHRRVYVALSGSPSAGPNVDESKLPPPDHRYDGIGVVDLDTQKLINTYQSGADPETFALAPDGRTLYVSNEDSAGLSALDLEKGVVARSAKVGTEPEGVAVSADNRKVYVACETANSVYVVDAASMQVLAQIPTGKRPRAILLVAEAHRGYVTSEFSAAITVFSTDDYKVLKTIELGDADKVRPMGIASPDGHHLYVTTGRYAALLEVDADSGTVLRQINTAGGLALSHDGKKAYTANGPSGDVSVIDLASGNVTGMIAVGGSPWGIVTAVR